MVNLVILWVYVWDLDSSSVGGIVYIVYEGNDNDIVLLNFFLGEIKFVCLLDFEERKYYLFVVKVIDMFFLNDILDVIGVVNEFNFLVLFFSFVNVFLIVLDVNDNLLWFVRDFYFVLIIENFLIGFFVVWVYVID